MKGELPKPIKSKNPVVILKHVIKAIKEEPKRYDQGTFVEMRSTNVFRDPEDFPKCNTICCVAGWVNVVAGNSFTNYERQSGRARLTLGLSRDEASILFDGDAVGNRRDMTPNQHAAAGIKHIKRFVLKKWGKKI